MVDAFHDQCIDKIANRTIGYGSEYLMRLINVKISQDLIKQELLNGLKIMADQKIPVWLIKIFNLHAMDRFNDFYDELEIEYNKLDKDKKD